MILEIALGTIGALLAGGAGARAGLALWENWEHIRTRVALQRHERAKLAQSGRLADLDLDRARWQLEQGKVDRARVLFDDENGHAPYVMMDSETILDIGRGLVLSVRNGVLNISPAVTIPEQRRRQLEAMAGLGAPAQRAAIEAEPGDAVHWPSRVTLGGLLTKYNIIPGYHNIVVGETHTNGQWQPVTMNLQRAVHVLISGASGFGKSTLLAAIAKQLVVSGNDVCAVDYGVNTFGELAEHLLYPIADDEAMTLALFQALINVMLERKERFKEYPGARDLQSYNRLSGESLRTITVLVDESSVLFDRNSQLKQTVTTLSQMSRKFGVGLLLAGTDFLASTIPTSATGNFGARCGFHLRPSLSQSLLYCRDAANLHDRGRLLMALPGVAGLTEIQAPVVDTWSDLPEPRPQEPLQPVTPDPAPAGRGRQPVDPDKVEQILTLHDQGESDTAIARQVFGYGNPFYIERVRDILSNNNNNGPQGAA